MIAVSLIGCGDGGGSGEPQDVTIDTFNVALAGAFIPYEPQRREDIPGAIAAQTSDIICLQEVWEKSDKESIRVAAADTYPYVAFFPDDDLNTPIDDATDQQGEIPPTPTTVPCETLLDEMNQAVDCLRDNCSTIPGSDEGRTTD
ncbi:MAG: hypothetical protein PVI24_17970, partial [Myxococcales bacterium]